MKKEKNTKSIPSLSFVKGAVNKISEKTNNSVIEYDNVNRSNLKTSMDTTSRNQATKYSSSGKT